jgi:hypothetical protein
MKNLFQAPRARVVPFIAYALFWTVMVVHAELMIRRNNIVYAYKGDQEVQMSDPVDFAQTLQLPQVSNVSEYHLAGFSP